MAWGNRLTGFGRSLALGIKSAAPLVPRAFAIVVFGLIVPVLLVLQAYHSMEGMAKSASNFHYPKLEEVLPGTKVKPVDHLDYTFAGLLFMESSNRQVMLSKQLMKMSVMQVGFAVISLGLMLILLGINAGGVQASVGGKDAMWTGSLKVTSSGVATFIVGAVMVTLGGVLRNDYQTTGIPYYSAETRSATAASSPSSGVTAAAAAELSTWFKRVVDECNKIAKGDHQRLHSCTQDGLFVWQTGRGS